MIFPQNHFNQQQIIGYLKIFRIKVIIKYNLNYIVHLIIEKIINKIKNGSVTNKKEINFSKYHIHQIEPQTSVQILPNLAFLHSLKTLLLETTKLTLTLTNKLDRDRPQQNTAVIQLTKSTRLTLKRSMKDIAQLRN